MSTLIERLIELGFASREDDNTGDWTKSVGGVVVQVRTHDEVWQRDGTMFGHTVTVEMEQPMFQIHLPHSCDEWVIADGPDPESVVIQTEDFSGEVQAAADLLKQVMS